MTSDADAELAMHGAEQGGGEVRKPLPANAPVRIAGLLLGALAPPADGLDDRLGAGLAAAG